MKFLTTIHRYLFLAAGVLTGLASCSDDPETSQPDTPQPEFKIGVQVTSKSFSSVTFNLTTEGDTPTLYAYTAVEKGTVFTAQQVYDEGIRAAVQTEPYTLSGLTNDTEYTLYAVAMGQNGLSNLASAEFSTDNDPGAPQTSKSIGIQFNEITQTGVNFSLQRGSEATGGMMAIWSSIILNNYVEDQIMLSQEDITREQIVSDLLIMGYGMEVDGTEQNADWTAEKLRPDADYTVMLMGLVNGEPADVSLVEFHTPAFDLIGNPTITLSVEKKDYMMAWIRYTLNEDAFGYMRYITDKSEVDRYLETHTEDDLREFTRFADGLFDQLGQLRHEMPDVDENGNVYKISSTNFGWDAAGNEYTAMAVACDRNYSVPKHMARIDFRLEEFPQGTDPALFTCEARNIAANNFDLHFEFDQSCMRAYCNVLPADGYRAQIEKAGGDLAYARALWDSGWVIYRTNEADPNSPIANQDDMFADVSPGGEYVIVATALNYQGVLNQTLTVSEPFRMKNFSYENSEAVVIPEVDRIEKTKARAIYRTGEKTRMLYNVTLEASSSLLNESEEAIRTYLMQQGNEWAYFHDKDIDWDPTVGAVVYTWPELTPGTDYVVLACGQDTEGRISEVNRAYFTTKAAIPGPDPQVQLNVYDLTPTSCTIDIIINDDVREYYYALIEEEVLNYVPGKDSQDVLEKEIYTVTRANGVPGYDTQTNLDASSLTYGGTFYLGAIAYGAEPAESFKYVKVQLPDPAATALPQLSSVLLEQTRPIYGGEEKRFEALREANLQIVDRSPIGADGVVWVRDRQDAQNVLEQMGGYRPMRSSAALLKQMKKF